MAPRSGLTLRQRSEEENTEKENTEGGECGERAWGARMVYPGTGYRGYRRYFTKANVSQFRQWDGPPWIGRHGGGRQEAP